MSDVQRRKMVFGNRIHNVEVCPKLHVGQLITWKYKKAKRSNVCLKQEKNNNNNKIKIL